MHDDAFICYIYLERMMDKKGDYILKEYWNRVVNEEFDEYLLLGFFILLRSTDVCRTYPTIDDFLQVIAHRKRNKGIGMDCIRNAIKNNYQFVPGTRKILDYHGMDYASWEREWMQLAAHYAVSMGGSIIKDITICVFSILQFTEYDDNNYAGVIRLMKNKDSLALYSVEKKPGSMPVCFARIEGIDFVDDGFQDFDLPVETKRHNGKLRLICNNQFII